MKCAACSVGQHDFCAGRDDVDIASAEERACDCTCIKVSDESALMALTQRAVEVTIAKPAAGPADLQQLRGEWPKGMRLADRLDALADQVALVPPKTPSERTEVGTALARYMLAARDGETSSAVVRRIVNELGWAESMSIGEVLGEWALAIAVEAEQARKAGGK